MSVTHCFCEQLFEIRRSTVGDRPFIWHKRSACVALAGHSNAWGVVHTLLQLWFLWHGGKNVYVGSIDWSNVGLFFLFKHFIPRIHHCVHAVPKKAYGNRRVLRRIQGTYALWLCVRVSKRCLLLLPPWSLTFAVSTRAFRRRGGPFAMIGLIFNWEIWLV